MFTKSQLGEHQAFCVPCRKDIKISHGGLHDLNDHIGTKKHKEYSKTQQLTQPISMFVENQQQEKVDRAEVLFSDFLVEHNIPLISADYAGPLLGKMFPHSKIASQYGCALTKTTQFIGTLAHEDRNEIVEELRTLPFSLATDRSNDIGCAKLYPFVIKYYSEPNIMWAFVSEGVL